MSRYYLLMIFGFLFLIFPILTGSFQLEMQMGQDTNQEELTHKETSTWSRMPEVEAVHAHRLCEGYYDLLKLGSGAVERRAKMASLSSSKKSPGPISALLIKSEQKQKGSVNPPTIKYDATDDRSEARSQCMARRPLKKKEKIKQTGDQKPFDESKKIQTKDRENVEEKASAEKSKIAPIKYRDKAAEKTVSKVSRTQLKKYEDKPEGKASGVNSASAVKWGKPEKGLKVTPSVKHFPMEAKINRILELNQIYNDYLKAWQHPPPNNIPENKKPGTPINFSSLKLNALTDLMNILEHFQQGNLVKDLAKKISQEMEPNLPKQMNQDARLVSDSRASLKGIIKNDLSSLFKIAKPSNASTAFKEILADIKSRRDHIKVGELYDEYKKGFCKVFNPHKHPRQLDTGNEVKNPTTTCEPIAEYYTNKNKNYLKTLEAFIKMNRECNRNGGSKPYYLPMSKNRQLVHNDIPLIRPGFNQAPKKSLNKESGVFDTEKFGKYNYNDCLKQENNDLRKTEQKTDTKEPFIGTWKDLYSGLSSKHNYKDFLKHDTTGMKKPAQKVDPKDPLTYAWSDLYTDIYSKYISNGIKAIKNASFFNLLEEYQKQVECLSQAIKNKQEWWKEARDNEKCPVRKAMKRNTQTNNPTLPKAPKRNIPMNNIGTMPFPEVLVNQAPQMPANVLGSMASQMNVSPIEMARRIVGAGQPAPAVYPRLAVPQMPLASQFGSCAIQKLPETTNMTVYQPQCNQQEDQQQKNQKQQQQQQDELSPVLDKILQRLETIQAAKCNKPEEEEAEKNLPCCFVDPADGAPCDLNGSWESLVLGIRINIKAPTLANEDKKHRPTCVQPKAGRAKFADDPHRRLQRQCSKIGPSKLKQMADAGREKGAGISLNVSVQETVPPRPHDLLDNLTDWHFSGNAQMTLGGPISLSFRKNNANLIGHFVGYCRTCGCMDTIFGSWTFCQPSRDCQDIFTSIVDRRDMLRRYSMDERRKNRYKEQLFLGSKFGKMEAERMRSEQGKPEKHQSPGHSETGTKG